jgi:hypothetical protein
VFRASVPETPVNENGEPFARKDEVTAAAQTRKWVVHSKPISTPVECAAKR